MTTPDLQIPAASFAKHRRTFALALLLAIVSIGYPIQVFSPLRLNTDAIVLLKMGESASTGRGYIADGTKTVFPPGYPSLLALLLKAGVAHPAAIILLNLFFLGIGIVSTFRILKLEFGLNAQDAALGSVLPLFSYIVIKHSTLPLTDVPFFGCASATLALLAYSSNARVWRFLLLMSAAAVCVASALTIRRIGVALIPAWISVFIFRQGIPQLLKTWFVRRRAFILVSTPVLLLIVVWGASHVLNLSDFAVVLRKSSPVEMIGNLLYFRITEAGEFLMNLPQSKVPHQLRLLTPAVGVVAIALLVRGLFSRRNDLKPVDVFVIFYLGILFVWPFPDSRFWLPIIPFALTYISHSLRGFQRASQIISLAYSAVFVVFGLAALGYTTKVTLSGRNFPDVYGDGTLRASYCVVYQSCNPPPDARKVDQTVVNLLHVYK